MILGDAQHEPRIDISIILKCLNIQQVQGNGKHADMHGCTTCDCFSPMDLVPPLSPDTLLDSEIKYSSPK